MACVWDTCELTLPLDDGRLGRSGESQAASVTLGPPNFRRIPLQLRYFLHLSLILLRNYCSPDAQVRYLTDVAILLSEMPAGRFDRGRKEHASNTKAHGPLQITKVTHITPAASILWGMYVEVQ